MVRMLTQENGATAGQIDDLVKAAMLSRAMLTQARDQAWENVMELENERRSLFESFFSVPVAPADAEPAAHILREIIQIDQGIKELAELKRFDLMQDLQGMEQGKKAIKAYTS